MSRTIQILAAAGFIAVLLSLAGAFDYADALNTDADLKNARAEEIRAVSDAAFLLTHPIPYNAIVCQSGPGETRTCRFYTERNK